MKVGILGGGQLARMLALSAHPLGIEVLCIDPDENCPATKVARVIHANFSDTDEIIKHFQHMDCITYETENLPIQYVEEIGRQCFLKPDIEALRITQDRLLEKKFLSSLDIPTAGFRNIESWEDVKEAIELFDFPVVLKTRKSGYDGKGQAVVENWDEARRAWKSMCQQALIIEKFMVFDVEISVIAVRNQEGHILFYPLTLNEHRSGILYVSRAPYINENYANQAQSAAKKIMEALNYVGVMAIEFFCKEDALIVNEIAPRVHNSGHWTIEAAETSQFENHLRAILGLPLGSTKVIRQSAMLNLIGKKPDIHALLEISGLHFHWYDKLVRPNRKLGHITLCADDSNELARNLEELKT
jgi:5-(carboxyamino)imidazole ribonucleotide synthase